MVAEGWRLAVGQKGLNSTAVVTKKPVLVADTRQDPNWLPNKLLPDTRSELAVPILMHDEVLGVLDVQQDSVNGLTEADQTLLLNLCGQVASAMQNTRLLSQVREALDEQSRLYESNRAIAMATTRESLTEIIVQQIAKTNIDRCEILFFEERGRRKMLSVVGGWPAQDPELQPGTQYRYDSYPLLELVQQLDTKGTQVIVDAQVETLPKAVQDLFAARGIKALALLPLLAGQEYIGFISIERHMSAEFNAKALRLYETIASQSTVALRNVQLIAQSQQQLDDLQKSYDDVARLANTVRQLSSPVIQIWEDVLVLPLVGTIDSQRAMRIMEDLLTGITRFQAEQVIIDVTGVPVMDGAIVNHLMQTIKAATLLGAKCMLVGIDSEKAQTIVTLGLDWKGIRTFSNLRAGIQAALQELGFAIMPFSPFSPTEEEQVR
jgi:anti-anti-sigma regulatory factor/GAF domain-containing protein